MNISSQEANAMNIAKRIVLPQPVPRKKRTKVEEPEFPSMPVVIQAVKTPRGIMNHSYRDFSKVPPQKGYEHPKEIKDMTFSQKVHDILSTEEYEKWISWMPHGRSFKIHVPVMFESQVCPKYFNHKRYSSFLRELNNYGFKHISKGTDRNTYYNEFMLKDRPHLCQYMPKRKDARRLVADPANEPHFYMISRKYPLDGSIPEDDNKLVVSKQQDQSNCARVTAAGVVVAAPVTSALNQFMMPPVASLTLPPLPMGSANVAMPSFGGLERMNDTKILLALLEAKQKKEREEQQAMMKQNALVAALRMFPAHNHM
mmetsp:Transcript_14739/g.28004  ORF Transcript_14739/g.28004 Transcript_14739/m.28004 type:complete len:314 (+) Transcript_14739:58-999(+)